MRCRLLAQSGICAQMLRTCREAELPRERGDRGYAERAPSAILAVTRCDAESR